MAERGFMRVPLRARRVAHFLAGRECDRSGCHRTGLVDYRGWRLCKPCADAVVEVLGG